MLIKFGDFPPWPRVGPTLHTKKLGFFALPRAWDGITAMEISGREVFKYHLDLEDGYSIRQI